MLYFYKIEDFSRTLLGKKVSLKVIGYCSDGKNSGFEIAPHITVSMSENAKEVYTGFLKFEPIKELFEISGMGGFFVVDRAKGTSSVVYEDFIAETTNTKRETPIEKLH